MGNRNQEWLNRVYQYLIVDKKPTTTRTFVFEDRDGNKHDAIGCTLTEEELQALTDRYLTDVSIAYLIDKYPQLVPSLAGVDKYLMVAMETTFLAWWPKGIDKFEHAIRTEVKRFAVEWPGGQGV